MKNRFCFPINSARLCAIGLVFLQSSCVQAQAPANAAPIIISENGRSDYTIVHAPDAPQSVKTAAQELQAYFEKASKLKLPIVTADKAPESRFISLGENELSRTAKIETTKIALEGFRIVTQNNNVYIVGSDTPDGKNTPQGGTSNGTLNGVYTFLEDYLNVRWLMPGEMGEDIPAMNRVALPVIDRVEAPGFLNRRMPYIQNEKESVKDWQRRQKLGFSMTLNHGHNWQKVVPPELFEQHPDWFAEMGGKRVMPVGDRYKIETTNPEVVQHYAQAAIEAFRADPNLFSFSLSPTDSRNWSESAASKALYDKDPHGKFANTPLILKFYNDVAKIVGKEFPDRRLAGYIYADYLYPPSSGVPPLEPNLFLVIAPSISYGYTLYRPGVQKDWDDIFTAWSSQTKNISYYDLPNWVKGSSGTMTPAAPEILNFIFPRLVKYNVQGVYIYGSAAWAHAGINNYVLGKLMWNPRLDANTIAKEFNQRAYGPAAPQMEQIYTLIDNAVKQFYLRDETASWTVTPAYMKDVLAANYPRVEELFLAAQTAAKEAMPQQRARLDFFGDNLELMQWQLRAFGYLPENKTSPFYRTDAQIEALLSRDNQKIGVSLAPDLIKTEKKFAPLQAAAIPTLKNAQPITPYTLRGATRLLFMPSGDHEIQVTPRAVNVRGEMLRYDIHDALGQRIGSGVLRPNETVRFAGSQNQLYYFDINANSASYQLEIRGAPFAIAGDYDNRGLRFLQNTTPLYFHVPTDVESFSFTVQTDAPGETSLAELYTPDGKLAQTLDTQTQSVAKFNLKRADFPNNWEGFWRLEIKKAATGMVDDVHIKLSNNLPQWFTVDPTQPLRTTIPPEK